MSDYALPSTPDWAHAGMDEFAACGLLARDATLVDVVDYCRGRLAYLATPYSKIAVNQNGMWDFNASMVAMMQAARWSRRLGIKGVTAISSIIQSVEMVHAGDSLAIVGLDPLDAGFWENWCRPLLAASGVVIVPPIDGWAESNGIWKEACAALHSNRRVFLIRSGEDLGGTK